MKPAVGGMAGFLVGLVLLMTVGEPIRTSNQLLYVTTAQPTAVQTVAPVPVQQPRVAPQFAAASIQTAAAVAATAVTAAPAMATTGPVAVIAEANITSVALVMIGATLLVWLSVSLSSSPRISFLNKLANKIVRFNQGDSAVVRTLY
jgi:hypothetical protein|uniref:Uncharacterized protein n=1 Tax=Eutreptiella gymnastica TaxID=73025 RepID=A0A7S1NJE4_9EUGL|mmetsp:Transcript_44814/g.80301  ORF Transcript_44814/g.80301 Transcript_44814/m.80301 type:complete len:147 (+) Transcript_44814:414-854(+)